MNECVKKSIFGVGVYQGGALEDDLGIMIGGDMNTHI